MFAILENVTDWLRATTPGNRRQTDKIQLADKAILKAPGSKTTQNFSLQAFMQNAGKLQDYLVLKMALCAPDAPISRMLLPHEMAEMLDRRSLSSIFHQVMTGSYPKVGTTVKGEFYAWSLMDHVLAFPYFHPDGFVRGTDDFLDWVLSTQKQYAMLMHTQHVLKAHLTKLWKAQAMTMVKRSAFEDWIVIDRGGARSSDLSSTINKELVKVEEEYRNVSKQIIAFRREQQMLQKAYLRIMADCPKQENANPVPKPSPKASMTILRPLNPGHKRKAEQSPARPSASRDIHGHVFTSAQKKQRKTNRHPHPKLDLTLPAENAEAETATEGDWILVDHEELDDWVLADNEDIDESAPNVSLEAIEDLGSSIAMSDQDMGFITATLSDLELTRSNIVEVTKDFQKHLLLGPVLDAFEDAEATLNGFDYDLEDLKQVQNDIAAALERDAEQDLSVEEIAAAISPRGTYFLDLVEQFADRVPDTLAGIKELRQMIDEAGWTDKVTDLVYLREPMNIADEVEGLLG